MNIIQRRIEKTLVVTQGYTPVRQAKHGKPRRGSYQKGVTQFTNNINLQMSDSLKARLDDLATRLNVTRSVIARDALEFYLGIAEQEFAQGMGVATTVRKR